MKIETRTGLKDILATSRCNFNGTKNIQYHIWIYRYVTELLNFFFCLRSVYHYILSEPFNNFWQRSLHFISFMNMKYWDGVKKTIIVVACHYEEFHIYFRGQKLTSFKFKGLLFFFFTRLGYWVYLAAYCAQQLLSEQAQCLDWRTLVFFLVWQKWLLVRNFIKFEPGHFVFLQEKGLAILLVLPWMYLIPRCILPFSEGFKAGLVKHSSSSSVFT